VERETEVRGERGDLHDDDNVRMCVKTTCSILLLALSSVGRTSIMMIFKGILHSNVAAMTMSD